MCSSHLESPIDDHKPVDLTIGGHNHEDQNLLVKLSHAQKRITELDQAVHISNAEFSKLLNNRQRLQAKIDVLEAEIEELRNSIDVSRKGNAVRDAQYSHIVELSTRLQTQSLFDCQQRKIEQETWAQEKCNMEGLMSRMRLEISQLRGSDDRFPEMMNARQPEKDDEVDLINEHRPDSAPKAQLETETRALQCANAIMSDALVGIRKEYAVLNACIEKMSKLGNHIQSHLSDVEDQYLNLDRQISEG